MNSIIESFAKALSLILSFDKELLSVIFLSLKVSGTALVIASAAGLTVGAFVGLRKF